MKSSRDEGEAPLTVGLLLRRMRQAEQANTDEAREAFARGFDAAERQRLEHLVEIASSPSR